MSTLLCFIPAGSQFSFYKAIYHSPTQEEKGFAAVALLQIFQRLCTKKSPKRAEVYAVTTSSLYAVNFRIL
jgi:hypothetical protein